MSRQPIYASNMNEFGYELLYGSEEVQPQASTPVQTKAEGLLNTFEIGLEELVGQHLAFINVDGDFIASNYCESLPEKWVALEVLSPMEPDEELLRRLRELRG